MLSIITLFKSVSGLAKYFASPNSARLDLISARKAVWMEELFAKFVKMVLKTLELTSTLVKRISSRVARNWPETAVRSLYMLCGIFEG